jgi:NitT/TauT family transport system substrate-binding protein
VAGIAWVGYEPLFLARELGYYDDARLRLVELPSSTANLMALASGEVEAATLTLDELLIAREGKLDLQAIWVFDESAGADVVMARPTIQTLVQLRGQRIGVEETAVGALMLAQLLAVAQLQPTDVVKVSVSSDRHVAAYAAGEIDAVVCFEPFATQLAKHGARRLLDSSRFPGLIVDLLGARSDALAASPNQFRQLAAGYFRALDYLTQSPERAAALMAPRMNISPEETQQALKGVHLMDLAANHALLDGSTPQLPVLADTVGKLMVQAGLLRSPPALDRLMNPRHLPRLPPRAA